MALQAFNFYRVVNINLSGVLLLLGRSNYQRDCLIQTWHVRCQMPNFHDELCNVWDRSASGWEGGREGGEDRHDRHQKLPRHGISSVLCSHNILECKTGCFSWDFLSFCVCKDILKCKTQIDCHKIFLSFCVCKKIFLSAGKLCRRLNTKTLQAQERSASSQEPKRLPSSDKKVGKMELILSWKNKNITYFTPHDIL